MTKYSYFPGCSLKGTGRAYEESLLPVLRSLATAPRFRFEPLAEGELGGVEASSPDGALVLRNTLRSRLGTTPHPTIPCAPGGRN